MSLYALPEGLRRKLLHFARVGVLRAAELVKIADVLPTYHRTDSARVGTALVSYRPVTTERAIVTTATAECQEIISTLNERGLDVDLLSCSDTVHDGANPYDIVFGFGAPFTLAAKANPTAVRVLYCTEGPPALARAREEAAIERVRVFLGRAVPTIKRHSKLYRDSDISVASHLIVLGDDTARWAPFSQGKPVLSILPTGFEPVVSEAEVASSGGNRELVWMGSAGAINKGLDLAFALADATGASALHLLGLNRRETALLRALTQLYPKLAVHDHGFLAYGRETFAPIIRRVDAAVLPSASEAAPTGCLTLCRNGVPAVVSSNCGLTCAHTGIQVCKGFDEMAQALEGVFSMTADERAELRLRTARYANECFALGAFSAAIRVVLPAADES